MKRILFIAGILVCTGMAVLAAVPRVQSAEPQSGKAGDEIVVHGENLDATSVTKLFLSDSAKDTEVKIMEQTTETIKFAIPSAVKPGRYNVAVQTAGPTPTIMVAPVFCTVEE
jgi:hypothetical protein